MNLLRLAVLGFLFVFLYRLLKGLRVGGGGADQPASPSPGGQPLPSQDVLVQDPVCKTYIPKGQAVTLSEGGQTFHFCSERCCRAFLAAKDNQGASA